MDARPVEQQVQCRGLNTRISAEGNLITASRVLPPRKIEIPISQIRTVELVVSSIFPPILLSLSGVTFLIGVWWFAGGGSWPVMLHETYRSVSSWAVLAAVLGLTAAGYAWAFAKINITTINNHMGIVIRMVPRRSGERFVNSLRRMMRLIEE